MSKKIELPTLFVRDGLEVILDPGAIARRAEVLGEADMINRCDNAAQQELAVEVQANLVRFSKDAEAARIEFKKPYWNACCRIDEEHGNFSSPVDVQIHRVSKLIGNFQALERSKARDAESARVKKLGEIERQRLEELAKVQSHDERDAVAEKHSDAARAAGNTGLILIDVEPVKNAEGELCGLCDGTHEHEHAQSKCQACGVVGLTENMPMHRCATPSSVNQIARAVSEINARAAQQVAAVPVVAPTLAAGQSVKEIWKFEVVDALAFANARPECVNITAKIAPTNALLELGIIPPGVRAWKEVDSRVRATKTKPEQRQLV